MLLQPDVKILVDKKWWGPSGGLAGAFVARSWTKKWGASGGHASVGRGGNLVDIFRQMIFDP